MQYWVWLTWILVLFVVFFPRFGTAWEPQKPVEFVIPAGPGAGRT